MDNSLKTKEKTQTGGLTPPTRVKTKTFLIGNPRGPQGSRKIAGPAPAREPDEGDLSTPGQVGCEIVVPPRRSRSDSIRLPPGSPRSGRHFEVLSTGQAATRVPRTPRRSLTGASSWRLIGSGAIRTTRPLWQQEKPSSGPHPRSHTTSSAQKGSRSGLPPSGSRPPPSPECRR